MKPGLGSPLGAGAYNYEARFRLAPRSRRLSLCHCALPSSLTFADSGRSRFGALSRIRV